MGGEAGVEKALLAGEGAVDELIDEDEVAGRDVILQAAHRAQRDDVGHARALQRIDIGAVVDRAWRQRVTAPVARQEHHVSICEAAEEKRIRRSPEGRADVDPLRLAQTLDLVEAAAADNAEADRGGLGGHGRALVHGPGKARE